MKARSLFLLVAMMACDSSTSPENRLTPATIEIVSGDAQSSIAGEQVGAALVARVVAANGRAVPNHEVFFEVTHGGGTVAPATVLSDAEGLVRAVWTLGMATSDEQRVEVRTGAGRTGQPIAVIFRASARAGAPAAASATSGDGQVGVAGALLSTPLIVKVVDKHGNPSRGAPVVWSVTAGGGIIAPATATTNEEGLASAQWTLGPQLDVTHTVRAAVGTLAPVTFTASALMPASATVVMAGGDGQTGLAGSLLAAPLLVRVQLANGTPLQGARVNWVASSGSGTVIPGTSLTDGNGYASTRWSLGDVLGVASVRAAAGTSPAVTFTANVVSPPPPPPVSPILLATVTTGAVHSCGIDPGGAAHCWGANHSGQLGIGSIETAFAAAPVLGGLTFSAVSAGFVHTCGLGTGGVAYCWGENDEGQLGTQSTAGSLVPTPVAGGLSFAKLTSGSLHACGLTQSGAAYCWGWNGYGAVGDGSTSTRTAPVPVVGGVTFASITAGGLHTCGVTASGTAYCWGNNASGQLGSYAAASELAPVAVGGGLAFSAVSPGYYHSCGLTLDGAAYCWGWNDYGQLGDGSTVTSEAPRPVAGGLVFASLDAGTFHTCGVTTAGAAYCWGLNSVGELGNGTATSSTTPVPVAGGLKFSSISAAGWIWLDDVDISTNHSCGVTVDREAWCWGSNAWGPLGSGGYGDSNVPVRVVAGGVTSEPFRLQAVGRPPRRLPAGTPAKRVPRSR